MASKPQQTRSSLAAVWRHLGGSLAAVLGQLGDKVGTAPKPCHGGAAMSREIIMSVNFRFFPPQPPSNRQATAVSAAWKGFPRPVGWVGLMSRPFLC